MTNKTKKPLRPAARLAVFAALAAGCAPALHSAPSWGAETLSTEACQELPLEQLMEAINDGSCALDVLPAAGPEQVADRGTTGEQNDDRGDPPSGGGGSSDDGDDGDEVDDGDDVDEGNDCGHEGNDTAARESSR